MNRVYDYEDILYGLDQKEKLEGLNLKEEKAQRLLNQWLVND